MMRHKSMAYFVNSKTFVGKCHDKFWTTPAVINQASLEGLGHALLTGKGG